MQVDHIGGVPVLFSMAGNVLQVIRDGECVDHQWQESTLRGRTLQQRAHL